MKKVFKLMLVTGICTSFFSCSMMERQSAIKFNDTLVKINQIIGANGEIWGDSLKVYKETGAYTSLGTLREGMENTIQQYIEQVKTITPPGTSGDEFKNEELIFLKMEKRIIHTGFKPFENLTLQSTGDERQAIYDTLTGLIKEEQNEVDQLKKQQTLYAKANSFSLGEKNLLDKK